MKAYVSQYMGIVLAVIYRKELQPSSEERHFSNKACLIWKRMKGAKAISMSQEM